MRVEIDQSGKVEETSKPTILAFSNGISEVVMISSKTKKDLLSDFRKKGTPKLYTYRVFCAGIFLLLEPHLSRITTLVIDIEWKGKERLLKDILFEFFQKKNITSKPSVLFSLVGKNSNAHIRAWSTFRALSKKKPKPIVKTLTKKELASLAIKSPQKKTEV